MTRKEPGMYNRLIGPAEELTTAAVPLYGNVSAGYPAEAYNYIEDRIDLNKLIIRNKSANCCMWVTSQELMAPGIELGDLLVFDTSITPRRDAMCLYWIDEDYSLRRMEKQSDGVRLISPNPDVSPVCVDEKDCIERKGVLTHRLKKFANYRRQYGGYPVDVANYMRNGIDYNSYFLGEEKYWETIFYLCVEGESMIGDGIVKDDLLVIDRLAEVHEDSIVVFSIENNFTLKRIRRHRDYTELVASNPKFPSIRVDKAARLEPWGVLVGTVTNYLKTNYDFLHSL